MPLTLFKRGNIWHVRGTIAGQRVRQSTGLGDKRKADLYRARLETQAIERHTLGRQATLTFSQAALTYLEAGGEGRFMAALLDYFGPEFLLSDIDSDAVNRAAKAIYPDSAPATINRQLITPLSAVLNLAAEQGLCPARKLRRRREPKGRLRWLTPTEAEALIASCEPRLMPLIIFLLGTGCRAGEAFALHRNDLHLDDGQAYISDTKTGQPRMVRFPAKTRRALAAYGLPEAGAVFRTPKGRPYVVRENGGGQIQGAFNKARDAAGLGHDVTPHVLRHTWATWFYAQTRDFGHLMDLGGWSKADTANRYRKIAPDSLGLDLLRLGWDFRTNPEALPISAGTARARSVR